MADGYHERFFDLLAAVEDESFWFRARNRLLVSALRRRFAAAGSLLEVGCGGGVALRAIHDAFPQWRLGGGDLFPRALELARERVPSAELFQLDARTLPFEAEWDVVAFFDSLEHVEEDEVALSEARRALKPRGGLVVHVPQHPRLWSRSDEIAEHRRRYTRRELVGKVRAAGFEVLEATSFVSSLLPLVVLSRMRRELTEADLVRSLLPPRPVNRTLERILRGEAWLIDRGVRLPAGSSLFVVAQKSPT